MKFHKLAAAAREDVVSHVAAGLIFFFAFTTWLVTPIGALATGWNSNVTVARVLIDGWLIVAVSLAASLWMLLARWTEQAPRRVSTTLVLISASGVAGAMMYYAPKMGFGLVATFLLLLLQAFDVATSGLEEPTSREAS